MGGASVPTPNGYQITTMALSTDGTTLFVGTGPGPTTTTAICCPGGCADYPYTNSPCSGVLYACNAAYQSWGVSCQAIWTAPAAYGTGKGGPDYPGAITALAADPTNGIIWVGVVSAHDSTATSGVPSAGLMVACLSSSPFTCWGEMELNYPPSAIAVDDAGENVFVASNDTTTECNNGCTTFSRCTIEQEADYVQEGYLLTNCVIVPLTCLPRGGAGAS